MVQLKNIFFSTDVENLTNTKRKERKRMNEYLIEMTMDLTDEEWVVMTNHKKKARKKINEYDCDFHCEDSEDVA